MIDEKGRLFGKVNIIDLAFVLLLALAVGFYALTSGRGLETAVPNPNITIVVESEPLRPTVGDDIKPGDEISIWNGSTSLVIGKVDKVEFVPYPNRADVDGKIVVAPDPVYKMARLTITGPGLVGKNTITMNSQVVMEGYKFYIRSSRSNFYVVVTDVIIHDAAAEGTE